MKRFIRNYFTFTKRERTGTLVLCSICIVLLFYLYFSSVRKPNAVNDISAFEKEIRTLQMNSLSQDKMSPEGQNSTYDFEKKRRVNAQPVIQTFDPNGLPEEEWVRMGLSQKQAKSIKNFESKGGRFYDKLDVKKMYCISPSVYATLEPFIQINKESLPVNAPRMLPVEQVRMIELNTASRYDLLHIAVIDSTMAANIVKFRNSLGGFYSMEQLKEVQLLDTALYVKISSGLTLDKEYIRKVDINSASIDQLKRHPYIRFSLAKALVLYRETHGNFKTVEDIKKCVLVNEDLFRKIVPYLTVEQ